MGDHSVRAEYETLQAVRVHEPGFEALLGAIDPAPNHFARAFSLRTAKGEHRTIVETLESAGVDVHHLHEDVGDELDAFLRGAIEADPSGPHPPTREELVDNVAASSTYEQLQAILLGPTIGRTSDDPVGDALPDDPATSASTFRVERPISNVYFQRDCQIVGDRGPILPRPATATRERELPLVEAAWHGVGAEFAHRTSPSETLEGGDFLPAGEFALLGVSALKNGEEYVLRSSYDGGRELLDAGAVGYEEFGLVRPPLSADERLAERHDTSSRLLHLDGWLNIAAEGLAVAREPLLEAATVELFVREGDGYERRGSETLAALLERHDYEVIDAPYPERWATNFLTVDDGKVIAIYETDDGTYSPENNRTIERLKAEGVEVLPDGEGLDPEQLTNGGGGIHCMTSPIRRG